MLLQLITMSITGCEFFLTASFLVLLPGNLQGRRGAPINRWKINMAAISIRFKRQTLFFHIQTLVAIYFDINPERRPRKVVVCI